MAQTTKETTVFVDTPSGRYRVHVGRDETTRFWDIMETSPTTLTIMGMTLRNVGADGSGGYRGSNGSQYVLTHVTDDVVIPHKYSYSRR